MGIKRAVPIMPARDIAEASAFYEQLGFKVARPMDTYAIAEWDSAEVHLAFSPDPPADRSGCYLLVEGIDRLFETLRGRAVDIEGPLLQPWGLKEMYVVDPTGNLIRFAEGAMDS